MYKTSADLAARDGLRFAKGTAVGLQAAQRPLSLGYEIVSKVDFTTFEYEGVKPLADLSTGHGGEPSALYLVAGPLSLVSTV